MVPQGLDFNIEAGNTFLFEFYLYEDDNTTLLDFFDTDGASEVVFFMEIKRSTLTQTSILTMSSLEETANGDYITLIPDEPGLVRVKITANTTQEFPHGSPLYSILYQDALGDRYVIYSGRMEVRGPITRI